MSGNKMRRPYEDVSDASGSLEQSNGAKKPMTELQSIATLIEQSKDAKEPMIERQSILAPIDLSNDAQNPMIDRQNILVPMEPATTTNYAYEQMARNYHPTTGPYHMSMSLTGQPYVGFAPGPLPVPIPSYESTIIPDIRPLNHRGLPREFYINGVRVDRFSFNGDQQFHTSGIGGSRPHASTDPFVHGRGLGDHFPAEPVPTTPSPVAPSRFVPQLPVTVAPSPIAPSLFVPQPSEPMTLPQVVIPPAVTSPITQSLVPASPHATTPPATQPSAPASPSLQPRSTTRSPPRAVNRRPVRTTPRDPNGHYLCTKGCSGGLQPFSNFTSSTHPYGVLKDFNHCNNCIRRYRRDGMDLETFNEVYKNPDPVRHREWVEAEKRRKQAEKEAAEAEDGNEG